MSSYHLGQKVEGTVEAILPFGVFLRLDDQTKAYIRRRDLDLEPDSEPAHVTQVGERLKAVVLSLGKNDKLMSLSRRDLLEDGWDEFLRRHRVGSVVEGTVAAIHPNGLFVRLRPGIRGFVPLEELTDGPPARPDDLFWVDDRVEGVITRIDPGKKKFWVSIKARLKQREKAMAVFDEIGIRLEESDYLIPETTSLGIEENSAREEPLAMGPVLVVEDHEEVRNSLTGWLKQRGCDVEQAATLEESLSLVGQRHWGVILVDLTLFDSSGLDLVRHVRAIGGEIPICVMSTPDSLAEQAAVIEQVGISEVFPKPLDLAELEHFLRRLASGEKVKPWQAKPASEADHPPVFPELPLFEDSEESPRDRLQSALRFVTRNLRAQEGMIFFLDPISRKISLLARTGEVNVNQDAVYGLHESPVKDVILEGNPVVEGNAGDRGRARFAKLLDYLSFDSCLGVPIKVHGEVLHAAFFFHAEPDKFHRENLTEAYAGVALFSALLTEDAVNKRLQTMHPMLLSGELGAGFGHEVANKITGFEIQVRNLLRKCEGQDLLAQDARRLLDLALDIKNTVESFQQLSRTNLSLGDHRCDLALALQRAVLLLQPVARKEGVRIDVRPAENLPQVIGSAIILQQVFLNLMLNAVQHMARKTGQHRVLSISASQEQGQLPIKVRFWDSGPGIHRKLWEKCFTPGFSTRGGSGLGLFIARSLVQSLGGRMCVEESLVPLGTTMLVELPAVDERKNHD